MLLATPFFVPREDETSKAPAMEEGDGGQDVVWVRAG